MSLLPDPVGSDRELEEVRLRKDSASAVDLADFGMAMPKASAKRERELRVAFLRNEPVDYWEGEMPK